MKAGRSIAILGLLFMLLLPAVASAAGKGVATKGAMPSATAANLLMSYAQNTYGVTVTVSSASGHYGAGTGCISGSNALATAIASACRKAGGGFAAGRVHNTLGTGTELVTGDASVTGAGAMTSTTPMTSSAAVTSTTPITGAHAQASSFTYLQLALTGTVTFPTTASAAQTLATSTFPKLASMHYTPKASRTGTYMFIGRSATVSGAHTTSTSAGRQTVSLVIVYKNSAGQTVVGAAVSSGALALGIR